MLRRPVPLQLPAALAVSLAYLNAGMVTGWSSPMVPELRKNSSHIPLTADEGSWLASVGMLAALPPSLVAGVLVDAVGRRSLLLAAAAPFLAVALWQRFASSFWELLATTLLGSLGVAIILPFGPVYMVEVAEDHIRGLLVSLGTLMQGVGALLITAIGPQVSFFTVTEVMMIWPVVFVAVFWWMPESPYFLVAKHQTGEAKKALMRLRGKSSEKEVKDELEDIQRGLQERTQNEISIADAFRELRRNCTARRAFMVAMAFATLDVLCGNDAVAANSVQILLESGSSLDPQLSAIGVCGAQVLSSAVFSLLVDRLGRRPLLLLSFGGCCLATVTIGVYFFLIVYSTEEATEGIFWLPVTCLIVYTACFNMGGNALLWVLPSELVPPPLRVLTNTCVFVLASVLAFCNTKLFQVVADAYGAYIPFWFFATCAFVGLLFAWFFIPETKGRSLVDISAEMGDEVSPHRRKSSQPT